MNRKKKYVNIKLRRSVYVHSDFILEAGQPLIGTLEDGNVIIKFPENIQVALYPIEYKIISETY